MKREIKHAFCAIFIFQTRSSTKEAGNLKRSPASFASKDNSAKYSSKATAIDGAQGPVPEAL